MCVSGAASGSVCFFLCLRVSVRLCVSIYVGLSGRAPCDKELGAVLVRGKALQSPASLGREAGKQEHMGGCPCSMHRHRASCAAHDGVAFTCPVRVWREPHPSQALSTQIRPPTAVTMVCGEPVP